MKDRGFTLLELLVAITVLSLVSLISWRGLDSLISTRARLEPEAEEIRAMLAAFGQLQFDVSQVVNPVFVGLSAAPINVRTGDGGALEIIRFAPSTPEQASAVQMVVYRLRDGQLVREVSPPLRTIGLVAKSRFDTTALLGNLRSMQIRMWRPGQGWVDAGAGLATTPANPFGVPAGVEVTLERVDGTRLRRVVVTG